MNQELEDAISSAMSLAALLEQGVVKTATAADSDRVLLAKEVVRLSALVDELAQRSAT